MIDTMREEREMTTEAAKKLYEAQHVYAMEGKGNAIYNPSNRPIPELPVIYGFNNGGSPEWYEAVLLAEDGTRLGSHICSSEAYMMHDLGILEGTRPDRHETFKEHYPDGYRMEFVPSSEIAAHEKLNAAFKLNAKQLEIKEEHQDIDPFRWIINEFTEGGENGRPEGV